MDFRRVTALLLGCVLSMVASVAQAQDVAATVSMTSGTVVVQKADGSVRSLAPDSLVQAGDVISTQSNSTARLKFTDGGELTVSSNSQLKLDAYRFNAASAKDDNLVMSLLKGGMRNITGLISRRGNRDAYRLQTATATIGIRGTDYIARLCEDDCVKEAGGIMPAARAIKWDIAARVAILVGQAVAIDRLGTARPLTVGGAIYTGEIVETRVQSFAVLAFLDEGRVTLQPQARFLIDRFRFEPGRTDAGQAVLRLLAGGMRVVTGLLVKRQPRQYRVETAVATFGIRGTGFDAWCSGACVDQTQPGAQAESTMPAEGLIVSTWEGEVEVRNPAGVKTVGVGQTVLVSARDHAPQYVPAVPPYMRDAPGPRPDGLRIDMPQLFGEGAESRTGPGLYVLVNDGTILLTQGSRMLELTRGESAFASFDQTQLYRLQFTPTFLERDAILFAPAVGGLSCGPDYR